MIDAASVPVIQGDMEALTLHATELRSVGAALADTGSRVNSTWQELRAVYHAPEAEELFAATLPVQQATASTGEDIEAVGTILIRYADEVRDIQARLKALSGQATQFQADMNVLGDAGFDQTYIDQNNELVAAVNAAVADFDDAQRRCANAINALYRSTPAYRAADDNGRLDPGEFGATAAQLDAAARTPAGVAWGDFELPAPPQQARSFSDYAQDALLVLGLVPVVGEPADALSAALYAADGDYIGAGLSAASAVPFLGWGAAGTRLAARSLARDAIRPASSAVSGRNLARSLASESQMNGPGKAIIGAGTTSTLRDAPRLAGQYGGNPQDWAKMASPKHLGPDGHSFETHWYENIVTGQRVEPKTKRFN